MKIYFNCSEDEKHNLFSLVVLYIEFSPELGSSLVYFRLHPQ